MCGIVRYIGPRDATPIIINGLKRLEYRGYDSAGIGVLNGNQHEVRKDAGKLSQLVDLVSKSPIEGAPGKGLALLGAIDLLSERAAVKTAHDAPWEGIDILKRMRKKT